MKILKVVKSDVASNVEERFRKDVKSISEQIDKIQGFISAISKRYERPGTGPYLGVFQRMMNYLYDAWFECEGLAKSTLKSLKN